MSISELWVHDEGRTGGVLFDDCFAPGFAAGCLAFPCLPLLSFFFHLLSQTRFFLAIVPGAAPYGGAPYLNWWWWAAF